MIKAIIFDLNGVFIQSPKLSDRFYNNFGVQLEIFMPALKEIMGTVRRPNAKSAFSYWKPYLEKWNVNLSEKEFFDFWFIAEKENPEMIELSKKLKEQGIKIFILSNNFTERTKYYDENLPFLKEVFEKVYYSWQTGFVKPDINAFQNLLTENGLSPEECVYFDDSEKNIIIADSIGIKGFIFKDAKETQGILKKLLKI
jgi:HAD superfamily hydrolase (TIGR01509 family)